MRRPSLSWVTGLAGVLILCFASAHLVRQSVHRNDLRRGKKALSLGQFREARDHLQRAAQAYPADPEIHFLLGSAEEKLGHPQSAVDHWALIQLDARTGQKAAYLRARTLVKTFGRLTEAERLLRTLESGHDEYSTASRWLLCETFIWEGRINEARHLIETGWSRSEGYDRVALLREHWRLERVVTAEEDVKAILHASVGGAPQDEGIRLVQATLATRYGRLADAKRWLDACRDATPKNPVVERAFLQWSMAAEEPGEMALALSHFSSKDFDALEILQLDSWCARRRKDATGEARALEEGLQWRPDDSSALDRLHVLAREAGDESRQAKYRRLKTEMDRLREMYRWRLINLPSRLPDVPAADLARIAEQLGRTFEAKGWWEVALAQNTDDSESREAVDRLTRRSLNHFELSTSFKDVKSRLHALISSSDEPAPSVTVPTFSSRATQAGLDFIYKNGKSEKRQVPETMGGGVALLDYDGDGFLDVYLVQGGAFPPKAGNQKNEDRLFRNRGNGVFDDVTTQTHLDRLPGGYGHGVAVGDIDNDGDPDLFVTRWRSYALYRNRGDGTFEDATESAGLAGDRDWPTSAAFADLDGDGDLDLYVCHYLTWDAENPVICRSQGTHGSLVSCLPLQFPSRPDHLFRNDGGHFVDITHAAGIVDNDGRGLGVIAVDLTGDSLIDLYVANDQTANRLYVNRGGMKFEEVGASSGLACGADGLFRAGMGVACGDLDRDGRPDLAVSNFFGESTTLFHNLGGGDFADETSSFGLLTPSRFLLGFGIAFLDANNDTYLDLVTTNGHVNEDPRRFPYAMPNLLLLGDREGRLSDAQTRSVPPWNQPVIGRGLATGDLDNDGDLDVVIVPQESPVLLLQNQTSQGHFLTIQLEGTRANREGVGARVVVHLQEKRLTTWRFGGGSYQSASDPRLHFGLGNHASADAVEVIWPSGSIDRFDGLDVDAAYLVREGKAKAQRLSSFQPRAPLTGPAK